MLLIRRKKKSLISSFDLGGGFFFLCVMEIRNGVVVCDDKVFGGFERWRREVGEVSLSEVVVAKS